MYIHANTRSSTLWKLLFLYNYHNTFHLYTCIQVIKANSKWMFAIWCLLLMLSHSILNYFFFQIPQMKGQNALDLRKRKFSEIESTLPMFLDATSYVYSTHDTPAYRPWKSFEGLQLLEDDRYVGCIIYTFVYYTNNGYDCGLFALAFVQVHKCRVVHM